MPSLESALMTHAGLMMDASALDAATLSGDFDEARFLAVTLGDIADRAGFSGVAEAADHLAAALGPTGAPPCLTFGPLLIVLADALDDADPRPRGPVLGT